DHAGSLQRQEVDVRQRQSREIRQTHFRDIELRSRHETALGQAPLKRHLAAFEADLVKAARTRLLALVAATGRLAEPRADAASDATPRLLAAPCGLDRIETHQRLRKFIRPLPKRGS